MHVVLLGAALLVGGLLAVQASVNQQLNRAVGTPYGAATLQLVVAALALGVVALVTGGVGDLGGVDEVHPWWLLLGGLASPLYITAGILLFPRLGALTAVGLFVTGQLFASLGLDLLGLLGVPREPPSAGIALGAVAVLAGITVVVRGTTPAGSASSTRYRGSGGWVALGLVAGAVLPVQGAVNARLRAQLGAAPAVGTVSFTVATLSIGAVLLLLLATGGTPAPALRSLPRMPWWGWLGGLCAATYVTATFLLIPVVGAAVTVALTVTGQQLASAAIDHRGWLGMPARALTRARSGGLVLLLAGSVLIQLT